MLCHFQFIHSFCKMQFHRLETADTFPMLSRAKRSSHIKLISRKQFQASESKTILSKSRKSAVCSTDASSVDVPGYLSSADIFETQFVSQDFADQKWKVCLLGRGGMNSLSKFGFVYFYLAFCIMILLNIPAAVFIVEVLMQYHYCINTTQC